MIKKYIKIFFIIILIAQVSGCAELRRKFIRKREPKKEDYSFYRSQKYLTPPPNERYRDHFVFWRNWQLDLERMEGTSHKRDVTAADEALRQLTEMRDLLQEDQAAALDAQIKKMEAITEKLKTEKVDFTRDIRTRRAVERLGRVIVKNFSYKKMKDHLISCEEEQKRVESED